MSNSDIITLAEDLVKKAVAAGADTAEAFLVRGKDQSVQVRNGRIEHTEFAVGDKVSVRAYVGKKVGAASSTNFAKDAVSEMIDRAVSFAKHAPEDPYAGIAESDILANDYDTEALKIFDSEKPSIDTLTSLAEKTEKHALDYPGVTNSEGAGASYGEYGVGLATSAGFVGYYEKTVYGLSCSVLAGEGVHMQRDYDYSSAVTFSDLLSPEAIGKKAAERAVTKLNPEKLQSGKFPIIYDNRIAASFLSYLTGAVSAAQVARGVSFLQDSLEKSVFAPGITIIDDPKMARGRGSAPFDADGVRNPRLALVEDGVLTTWLTSCASARQLGIENNGRGLRSSGAASTPGATNMYMEAGKESPEDLMRDIKYGFWVTETIGHGINEVTGDYSIGASGFLIEDGKLASPVSEVTVAGNLKDMFKNIKPANDLLFKNRKNAPSLRIDGLTIAGK